jgi:hypothetical protein
MAKMISCLRFVSKYERGGRIGKGIDKRLGLGGLGILFCPFLFILEQL